MIFPIQVMFAINLTTACVYFGYSCIKNHKQIYFFSFNRNYENKNGCLKFMDADTNFRRTVEYVLNPIFAFLGLDSNFENQKYSFKMGIGHFNTITIAVVKITVECNFKILRVFIK